MSKSASGLGAAAFLIPALLSASVIVSLPGCASRELLADSPPRRPAPSNQRSALGRTVEPQPYQQAATHNPGPVTREPVRDAAVSQAGRVHAAQPGRKTITVGDGDTLYSISRRHRVSIAALMDANGMRSPAIRPGDVLFLPR